MATAWPPQGARAGTLGKPPPTSIYGPVQVQKILQNDIVARFVVI
jgi:hypothetical protein